MNGILGPGGLDERFLTRNGHAARQLAALLIRQGAHGAGARLPRVRDVAELLGVGNGTVQSALRLLEEAGAIKTVARGHLGTFLVGSDRAALWRLSGLGAVQAAMPLPHSRRFEGLATGLRAAFEEAGAPFALTFLRGAAARLAALAEGRAELAVLSRFAADRLTGRQPVELIADLGPGTYVGAHALVLRPGVTLGSPVCGSPSTTPRRISGCSPSGSLRTAPGWRGCRAPLPRCGRRWRRAGPMRRCGTSTRCRGNWGRRCRCCPWATSSPAIWQCGIRAPR